MPGVKGRSGGRPLPTKIKELAGTLRADRTSRDEPATAALEVLPRCPAHLTGEARKAWRRIGQRLVEMSILTAGDLDGLEAISLVYGLLRDATERQDGVAVDKLLKHWRSWLVEFGLTPSARARVSAVMPKTEAVDPFEEMFIRNQGRTS